MLRMALLTLLIGIGSQVNSSPVAGTFNSIDGGTISLEEWRGDPVLVVNTASRCGFTRQYDGLQELYDQYRDRGLKVLAVPSDDFRQELSSAEAVKEFCAVNFGLDLPMTDITHVRGAQAHPFYQSVKSNTGFVPRWNFNKVLVSPEGDVVKTWGSRTKPLSAEITRQIEALLN
ncbi:glutathione peroxidase [Tropicimonas marinistellae]|uniref:glutathione peroxidase n=1 Tax=Tropicimonas marinistellae TaxID=1739787 RepID=UPI000834016C|nr:glutathione peroxidase [Tropicimonas marinistellae]